MQAWALQKLLIKHGHTPITIDRQPDIKNVILRNAKFIYKNAKNRLNGKKTLSNQDFSRIKTHTSKFIKSNILISQPIYSTQALQSHFSSNNYQAIIIGSDQTWRPQYSPNIYNFYLDFLEKEDIKKIAYATSFGVDEWEYSKKQTKKCASLSKKFNYIAVREKSGVALCKQYLDVSAAHVLDPTLLLEVNDYLQLLNSESNESNESNEIYTYILDKSKIKTDFIESLATKNGMKTFSHQAIVSHEYLKNESIENCIIPPVTSWLAGFRNAKFVVTDSFHGMIFSIIFNKPFLVILNSSRGATRFTSLLEQLDLRENIITTDKLSSIKNFNFSTENQYERRLLVLREKSISELLTHLK